MSDSATRPASIFERYARKATAQETPAEPQPSPAKAPYIAYTADAPRTRVTRLMIHYPDGTLGLMAYAYLIEAFSTSHEFLSLAFTNCIVSIEGRHLIKLVGLLQEERILELHCFDPHQHEAPDDGEPVITHMERRTTPDVNRARARAETE